VRFSLLSRLGSHTGFRKQQVLFESRRIGPQNRRFDPEHSFGIRQLRLVCRIDSPLNQAFHAIQSQKHVENHAIHRPTVKTDQVLNGLPKNEILWLSTLQPFVGVKALEQDWM